MVLRRWHLTVCQSEGDLLPLWGGYMFTGHPPKVHCHIASLVWRASPFTREYHSIVFDRKGRQLWEIKWEQLASSSVHNLLAVLCAINRIEFTNWACTHCNKLNSKWLPSLRLWVCTIDRINSGRSDAHRKPWHRGPARYKMECVNLCDVLKEHWASRKNERRKSSF